MSHPHSPHWRKAFFAAAVASGAVGLLLFAPSAAGLARAEEENAHLWRPAVRSVAVFKNGLGFFMREGEVDLREGWCVAEHVPPAAFGTLAIYAKTAGAVVDIVGSGPGEVVEFDGRDAPDTVEARRERLAASKHLKVELHYQSKGQDRSAAGRLVSVGPDFVVLDSGQNSFAVPIEGVSRMQILELPLRAHVLREGEEPLTRASLGMAYLRKGITWIPEYTLKVIDEETAELTLRGTLVNEAEDLIHADVHFVVGVPHFVHTEYMAPIAVGQVIRTIGAAVAHAAPQQVMTQVMNRAAIVSNAMTAPQFESGEGVVEIPVGGEAGDIDRTLGNLPQMGGAAATDYTVYTKQGLTVRRGEKAIVNLFTKRIKYGHIYRWSPPQAMAHALVLRNDTDTAWTTGPCLALSEERPLSEDLLKYTPKGGNGELPMTTAINIAHEKSEREIDRKLKAHNPTTSVYYDLVTLEGRLQLRNFERRSVIVVIDNPVPGKPTAADAGGALSVDPAKLELLTREGAVRWTVTLEPGEERTLTYQYERYVRSH